MRKFKRLNCQGRRLISAACLLFVLAVTTNAYSVVMRGGKRIEIPDRFSVTNLTLTYETAPGFWVTLQMSAIDIPATERANNEKPGSFLARATQEAISSRTIEPAVAVQQPKAARTITNRDLESFERQRMESERAYDQKLREMGLPPLAEIRAQAAAEADRLYQELAQKRADAEAREQAAQIQAQLAVLNAQLNLIQARLNDPSMVWPAGFPIFGGLPFFDSFAHSRVNKKLFRVPHGIPIGGAFGSLHVPFFSSPARRNIFVAPGTQVHRRMRFGGHRHGGRRSR